MIVLAPPANRRAALAGGAGRRSRRGSGARSTAFAFVAEAVRADRLEVWREPPPPLTLLGYPVQVPTGPTTFIVQVHRGSGLRSVPVPFAIVSLYKNGEVVANRYTDANGQAEIPIDPTSPGTLHVTAYTDLGPEGVAVAVAVPNVLFCLFAIAYACRVLDVSTGRYLARSWSKPLAAVCVPVAVWWSSPPAEPTWAAIALGVGVGLVPFAAVVVGMEFGTKLAARAARLVGRAVPDKAASGTARPTTASTRSVT